MGVEHALQTIAHRGNSNCKGPDQWSSSLALLLSVTGRKYTPARKAAVMASAGMPGMSGFISEFLVFRGAIGAFPTATLLCMVGSGLTAVYFLLLVNRVFFGRLAITPVEDPARHSRLDIRLSPVAARETIPATALALAVVLLGVVPALLGTLSETTTTSMAWFPSIVQAFAGQGVS
jgi:NAD(P)H-quinone oxidoreductase subunit 4